MENFSSKCFGELNEIIFANPGWFIFQENGGAYRLLKECQNLVKRRVLPSWKLDILIDQCFIVNKWP